MIALLCALASAAAFYLGHGTADVSLLAWIAPVPVLWLAFGQAKPRHVALAAAAAYALGQLGSLWPYYHAMGPVLLAAAALPALAFAGAVMAARRAARRLPTAAVVLIFPTLWTGWEGLSAALSPHGTFGAWAYSQVDVPVAIQGAAAFGLWVITFLIALFAAGAALTIRRRTAIPLAVASALVIANVAVGAWRLRQSEGPTIRVAAAARDHYHATSPDQVAMDQADEVRRLAAQGAAVVVFPEKVTLLPADRRDAVLAPLIAAARETGTTVVTGFDQTGPERRNAAYTITPDGRLHTYTKRHHIPGLERDYIVGTGPGLLADGKAVVICKDMDFQNTLRHDAAAGADDRGLGLMLAPAWDFDADGWLHARMAVMRGVEGGYAIVRAAANGLVTVSDAQGRLRARSTSGSGRYASVIADVPHGPGATPYVRLGDAFGWIAGAIGIGLLAWSLLPAYSSPSPAWSVNRSASRT